MIHVCYGLYDKDGRYSKFTATSMLSLFENVSTPPLSVMVHILHDNTLSPENRAKFKVVAECYGQIVNFYNVEELCPDKITTIENMMKNAEMFEKFSVGAAFRLIVHHVLPPEIDKVIYLDSDTIINLDVAEFWQIDVRNKPLASVAELDIGFDQPAINGHEVTANGIVDYRNYFCSGVLMVNLEYWHKELGVIERGIDFVAANTGCNFFDQDVLNYLFSGNYVHLPEKFDAICDIERTRRQTIRPAIYHYAFGALGLDMNDAFNRLWLSYFEKTPFFTAEAIGHLYEGVRQLHVQSQQFAINVSKIMSGKERAFFVPPIDIERARQIFRIKPEEEIIPITSAESLQNLIESIRTSGGRKIFFIMVSNFELISSILMRSGFVFGRDYVNALEFFSEAEGVPLDSYQLVKLL